MEVEDQWAGQKTQCSAGKKLGNPSQSEKKTCQPNMEMECFYSMEYLAELQGVHDAQQPASLGRTRSPKMNTKGRSLKKGQKCTSKEDGYIPNWQRISTCYKRNR